MKGLNQKHIKPSEIGKESDFSFKFEQKIEPCHFFQLSQELYLLVQELIIQKNPTILYKEVQTIILRHPKVEDSLEFLKEKLQFKHIKSLSKDRKTSFFRTILKELKQKKPKRKRSEREKKKIQTLQKIQKRVNKNTIKDEQIELLFEFWNEEIVAYLKSKKCIDDYFLKNKSKLNKDFYMFHLKEIAIEAENGNLAKFPFFHKEDIISTLRRMIKIFYFQIIKERGIQTQQVPLIQEKKFVDLTINEEQIRQNMVEESKDLGFYVQNFNIQFLGFSEQVRQLSDCP